MPFRRRPVGSLPQNKSDQGSCSSVACARSDLLGAERAHLLCAGPARRSAGGRGGKHIIEPPNTVLGPPPMTGFPPRLPTPCHVPWSVHRPDQSHFLRPPNLVLEGALVRTCTPNPPLNSHDMFPAPSFAVSECKGEKRVLSVTSGLTSSSRKLANSCVARGPITNFMRVRVPLCLCLCFPQRLHPQWVAVPHKVYKPFRGPHA